MLTAYYVSYANYVNSVVIVRLIMMIINIKLFGFHGSFIKYVHCYFIFNMCGKHIAHITYKFIVDQNDIQVFENGTN